MYKQNNCTITSQILFNWNFWSLLLLDRVFYCYFYLSYTVWEGHNISVIVQILICYPCYVSSVFYPVSFQLTIFKYRYVDMSVFEQDYYY